MIYDQGSWYQTSIETLSLCPYLLPIYYSCHFRKINPSFFTEGRRKKKEENRRETKKLSYIFQSLWLSMTTSYYHRQSPSSPLIDFINHQHNNNTIKIWPIVGFKFLNFAFLSINNEEMRIFVLPITYEFCN